MVPILVCIKPNFVQIDDTIEAATTNITVDNNSVIKLNTILSLCVENYVIKPYKRNMHLSKLMS